MIKVIIAGTRDFDNYELLKQKMDKILAGKVRNNEEIIIISGTARGADKLGERYAREKGYKIERYPANWDKHISPVSSHSSASLKRTPPLCLTLPSPLERRKSPGPRIARSFSAISYPS